MTQTSDKTAGANRRIEFLFWIMAVAGCVVVLQLLNLQVLRQSFYREKAQKMHLSTVKQQVGRGTIFDRNGKKVAESISAGSVYICPPEIREKNRAAALLSRELDLPLHVVMKKINSRNGFEYIKRKIDFEKADKILSHGIRGIYAQTEQKRFYPLGRAAAHITGFSGMDNNGLEGTELYYEKLLRGKTGRLQIRRDAKQRPVIINTTDIKKAEKGADLYLTIDSQVQYSAQAELDAAAEKYRAKAGSIIVMNPNNGAIYAMANYPSYDPNNMEGFGPESRKNRAVTDIYEPGSTFKIFPMSLYIREFKDADSQKVFCGNGAYEFFGRTVHDHEKHGWLTFDEVIKYSSNIGMVNLGLKVPQEKLYREFVNFGFGRPTRIDMPHEPSGILRHYKEWDNISLTSIPYGQEVAVTPIQMARAYAVIANGGFLITPHIVERAEKNGKVIYRAGKEKPVRVLGEKECERLSRMLVGVTDKDGSGKKAVITGYTVAGKTGTAQKHNEKGRGYA
ncbi:MAG TPA: penicillin-binding protein 2, partial [Candidatus Goldiibacteriota bacterium]|nr:penicillin-binding protein 2 [Candidatus Goldiibacteriota bacterium]